MPLTMILRDCRRAVLAAIVAGATLAVPAASAADKWQPANGEHLDFTIVYDSKPAGSLNISFSREGDTLLVRRQQTLTVKRFMITATLTQDSQERWVKQRFEGISSQTTLKSTLKDDKAGLEIKRGDDGHLTGKSADGPLSLADDTLPMSVWSADMVRDGSYFDPANGKLVQISGKPADAKDSAPITPSSAQCQALDLTTKAAADGKTARALVWRNADGKICAMRFFTDVGTLDYIPASDPLPAKS